MKSYLFGVDPVFELLVRERRLLANGETLPLGSRALDVLVVLVERAGQVVDRRELIRRVWPQTSVEENNLNVQISAIRRVLGDDLIATVPGRGYCFTSRPQTRSAAAYTSQRLRTNLPTNLVTLHGRTDELAELDSLIVASRLVTILGAGGIGKTLLAKHVLRRNEARFRHGGCLIELASVCDESAIAGTIATALQVQLGSGTPLAALAQAVAPLELIMVLDSAEHLLQGVGRAVLALLNAAPGLRLIVTSQAPVRLMEERLLRLGALSVPTNYLPTSEAIAHGAIALFAERAQAADSRFVLTDDTTASAIDLCRALQGLPLAIELAAWRAPTLGVRQLVESLDQPLNLLASQNLDAPARQSTIRGALSWSFGLLDPREQRLLRRMSVLRGTSNLELISDVACDLPGQGPLNTWAVVDAVSTLVDRSLVVAVHDCKSGVGYRLLDAPRSFAMEKLELAGESDVIRQRHAVLMAARFSRALSERFSGSVRLEDWQERELLEIENGRLALAWLSDHDDAPMLMALLPGLMRATPREDRDSQIAMVRLASDIAVRATASTDKFRTLLEASCAVISLDPASGLRLAEAAIEVASACPNEFRDERWLYRAVCQRTIALLNLGQTRRGEASLHEARAMECAHWPAVIKILRWVSEVWIADRRGHGEMMYNASLCVERLSLDAGWPSYSTGQSIMNGALAAGRAEEAVHHGLTVVAQLEGTRHFSSLVDTRVLLIGALVECNRFDEARSQSKAVWPLVRRHGIPQAVHTWADYHSLLEALEGQAEAAALLQGHANKVCADARLIRAHNEERAMQRARKITVETLGLREADRLVALGELLSSEDVEIVAFGARMDVLQMPVGSKVSDGPEIR